MRSASTPLRWFSWLPLPRNWCCTSCRVRYASSSAFSSRCWRWCRFSASASGRVPATMPCRSSPPSPALLGYHYYSWAFIGFAVAIVALAAVLLFDEQFRDDGKPHPGGAFGRAAVWLVIALTALNVVSTLLECGFGACPDNPIAYELLKRAP